MINEKNATIVAQATAPGSAGIGVIRLSGPMALQIASRLVKQDAKKAFLPRKAYFCQFIDREQQLLDHGLLLYFAAPYSFTGEEVVELQVHGAQVVLQAMIACAIQHGAQMAKPGEFSERAFLNNKIDLLQAEAIADLIAASSSRSARAALQSLSGVFSARVADLDARIKTMRVHIEAAIDFSDEAIEPLTMQVLSRQLNEVQKNVDELLKSAQLGLALNQGLKIALLGQPNVGKSSLMNALLGYDRAIVTDIAGTTRDVLQESFHIDGVRFELIDTAGLHTTTDVLEQEGMRRTRLALSECDLIVVVQDARQPQQLLDYLRQLNVDGTEISQRCVLVRNKADLLQAIDAEADSDGLLVSATTGAGLPQLAQHFLQQAFGQELNENQFVARKRHLIALQQVANYLRQAQDLWKEQVLDLLAEELRLAHQVLGELTGKFSSDQLLGEIFSAFCIGK